MSMKKKAANALMAMGLFPNLNGFSYIVDAVCMVADDISKPIKVREIYESVGKKHNVKVDNVERNIRFCVSKILHERNDFCMKYIGDYKYLTNSQFISIFAINLIEMEVI